MSRQKIIGPYRVKNIGVGGDVYEVVEMIDERKNAWERLRPEKTYLNRQSAYGKMARLNRRWHETHCMDEDFEEKVKHFS